MNELVCPSPVVSDISFPISSTAWSSCRMLARSDVAEEVGNVSPFPQEFGVPEINELDDTGDTFAPTPPVRC